jgi:hypothetical protein
MPSNRRNVRVIEAALYASWGSDAGNWLRVPSDAVKAALKEAYSAGRDDAVEACAGVVERTGRAGWTYANIAQAVRNYFKGAD